MTERGRPAARWPAALRRRTGSGGMTRKAACALLYVSRAAGAGFFRTVFSLYICPKRSSPEGFSSFLCPKRRNLPAVRRKLPAVRKKLPAVRPFDARRPPLRCPPPALPWAGEGGLMPAVVILMKFKEMSLCRLRCVASLLFVAEGRGAVAGRGGALPACCAESRHRSLRLCALPERRSAGAFAAGPAGVAGMPRAKQKLCETARYFAGNT